MEAHIEELQAAKSSADTSGKCFSMRRLRKLIVGFLARGQQSASQGISLVPVGGRDSPQPSQRVWCVACPSPSDQRLLTLDSGLLRSLSAPTTCISSSISLASGSPSKPAHRPPFPPYSMSSTSGAHGSQPIRPRTPTSHLSSRAPDRASPRHLRRPTPSCKPCKPASSTVNTATPSTRTSRGVTTSQEPGRWRSGPACTV